jgi:outer membrane protein assembly factor BamB
MSKPYVVQWQRGYFDGALGSGTHSTLQGSSPLIDDGNLFFGTLGGSMVLLDGNSTRPIWRNKQESVFEGGAAMDASHFFVGNLDGELLAVNKLDGSVDWTYTSDAEIMTKPTVVGDFVVFSDSSNSVVALNKKDGSFIWRYREDAPERLTIRGSSAVALMSKPERLFVGFSKGVLVALNPKDGDVIWRKPIANDERYMDIDGTPRVVGNIVLAAAMSGPLVAFRADGSLLWVNDDVKSGAQIAILDKTVFAGTSGGQVVAVGLEDGKTIWQTDLAQSVAATTLLIEGNNLIVGLSNGNVVVVDPKKGDELWRYYLADRVRGELIPTGNGFLVMDGHQSLFRFKK